jgi:membrane protease YdiL (CAAX protease family)
MFQRLGALLLVGTVALTGPTMTAAFFLSSAPLPMPKSLHPAGRDGSLPKTKTSQRHPLTPRFYRDRHADDDHHTDMETRATSTSTTTSASASASAPREQEQAVELQAQVPVQPSSSMNLGMIQNVCLSQGVILALTTVICAVGVHYAHADWSILWHWSPLATASTTDTDTLTNPTLAMLVQGVGATLPLIALETRMGKSEHRDARRVNFATTNMVVTLFGRRHAPRDKATPTSTTTSSSSRGESSDTTTDQATTLQVMASSLLVTTFTAVSEEIVFRGYLSGLVMALTGSWAAAWLGPALLFGAGHWHVSSSPGENKIVTGLQTVNGLWYGLVYMVTGSLVPGIMAHMLYDSHILVATWHAVNEQMDWTEEAYPTRLTEQEEADIREIQRISDQALDTETLNFCKRFFYAFDHDHAKSLSLQDVQMAVSFAFLQDKVAPSTAQVQHMFAMVLDEREHRHFDTSSDDNDPCLPADRLRLTEFLRLLFALRAQTYQKASTGTGQPAFV